MKDIKLAPGQISDYHFSLLNEASNDRMAKAQIMAFVINYPG